MEPCLFNFEITRDGMARSGYGVVAAYVPATEEWPGVVVFANDPCHDPGWPIEQRLTAAIQYVVARTGFTDRQLCFVAVDALGRFARALPHWSGSPLPRVDSIIFERFKAGSGVEAFLAEAGPTGEVALEMLSSMVDTPIGQEETPSAAEFLDTVAAHEHLPVPGTILHQIEKAAAEGEARNVARLLQADAVISSAILNYANAARFAESGKTASILKAVQRLGLEFVQRLVFVASMMLRYRKGRCAAFDHHAYWMNAIATGSAMRAMMPHFDIPDTEADDVFAAGLVSSIGWLAVAETYPAIMSRYINQSAHCDPIARIRTQREIFPCPIRLVTERYLSLYAFPDTILATVAGKTPAQRNWRECLAHATRAAQSLAPFDCLAVLPLAEVPLACVKEWDSWRSFLADMKK